LFGCSAAVGPHRIPGRSWHTTGALGGAVVQVRPLCTGALRRRTDVFCAGNVSGFDPNRRVPHRTGYAPVRPFMGCDERRTDSAAPAIARCGYRPGLYGRAIGLLCSTRPGRHVTGTIVVRCSIRHVNHARRNGSCASYLRVGGGNRFSQDTSHVLRRADFHVCCPPHVCLQRTGTRLVWPTQVSPPSHRFNTLTHYASQRHSTWRRQATTQQVSPPMRMPHDGFVVPCIACLWNIRPKTVLALADARSGTALRNLPFISSPARRGVGQSAAAFAGCAVELAMQTQLSRQESGCPRSYERGYAHLQCCSGSLRDRPVQLPHILPDGLAASTCCGKTEGVRRTPLQKLLCGQLGVVSIPFSGADTLV